MSFSYRFRLVHSEAENFDSLKDNLKIRTRGFHAMDTIPDIVYDLMMEKITRLVWFQLESSLHQYDYVAVRIENTSEFGVYYELIAVVAV